MLTMAQPIGGHVVSKGLHRLRRRFLGIQARVDHGRCGTCDLRGVAQPPPYGAHSLVVAEKLAAIVCHLLVESIDERRLRTANSVDGSVSCCALSAD